jgi:hypothetical protein
MESKALSRQAGRGFFCGFIKAELFHYYRHCWSADHKCSEDRECRTSKAFSTAIRHLTTPGPLLKQPVRPNGPQLWSAANNGEEWLKHNK